VRSAGEHAGAERRYREAVELACEQGAVTIELRAANRLARLWGERGERQRARELLGPLRDRFTKGLGAADLEGADAVLGAL